MPGDMEKGSFQIEMILDDSDTTKTLSEIESDFEDFSSNNKKRMERMSKHISGAEIDSVKKQKKAHKEFSKDLKNELDDRLKANKKNASRMAKIREDFRGKELKAEREHQKRLGALRQKTVGGRAKTRFKEASAAKGGGIGGMIAGAGAALGPAGIAIGAAMATVGAAFNAARVAAKEFEDGAIRIKTLLTEEQAAGMNESLAMLRQTAKDTGEEITGLENAMYNVISAAPSLANNLSAAASIVDKASKTAVGLGTSTEAVTSAMMNLGNAFSMNLESVTDQEKILDVLANTMKQGVIPSGEILARQIAKTAPAMKALSVNTDDALNAVGSMTAALTKNGVSMEESQTQIKAVGMELLDSAKAQKLMAAGVEGFDPQTGKIANWSTFMKSASQNMDVLMETMTSSEAQNAIRILADNGGKAFADLQVSMEESGGTADTMFQTMADSSEVASKRLDASINDLKISAGSAVNTMVTDLTNMASSTVEFLSGLFGTAQQKYEKLQGAANKTMATAEGVSAALAGVSEAMAPGAGPAEMAAAFDTIRDKMGDIATASPFLADQIKQIMSSPLGGTAEGLEKINGLLKSASDMANALALDDQIAAGTTQLNAFEETLEQIHGLTVGQGSALDEQTVKLREQEKMQAQAQAMLMSENVSAETKLKIQKGLTDLNLEMAKTKGQIAKVDKGITGTIQAQLKVQENIAAVNGDQFDAEAAKEKILADMVEQVGATEFLEERISELLDQQVDSKIEAEELAEMQIEAETAITEQMEAQGITADSSNEQRIAALNTIKVQNDAEIAQWETKIGMMKEGLKLNLAMIEAKNAEIIAGGGVAVVSEAQIAAMRTVTDDAEARVKILKAQNAEIGKQIAGLQKTAGAGAGPAKGKASAKGQARAAEKVNREAAKMEAQAAKKAAEIRKKEQAAQLKALEEKLKLQVQEHQQKIDQLTQDRADHKDRIQAQKEMLKALQEFQKDLKDKVNAVRDADFDTLAGLVEEFIPIAERIALKSQEIMKRFTDARGDIEKQKADLIKRNNELGTSIGGLGLQIDAVKRQLRQAKEDLRTAKSGVVAGEVTSAEPIISQKLSEQRGAISGAVATTEAGDLGILLRAFSDYRANMSTTTQETIDQLYADSGKILEAAGIAADTRLSKRIPALEQASKILYTQGRTQKEITAELLGQQSLRDQNNALNESAAETAQLSVDSLIAREKELTAEKAAGTAEREKGLAQEKALGTAAEEAAKLAPVTALTASTVQLAEMLTLQEQIADKAREAAAAEDYDTRIKLLAEMNVLKAQFLEDFGKEKDGVMVVRDIVGEIDTAYKDVNEAIEKGVVLSQEHQQILAAVPELTAEYTKVAEEIENIGTGFKQTDETRRALAEKILTTTMQELEHKKAMGDFDGREIQFQQAKVTVLLNALQVLKDTGGATEEIWKIEEQIRLENQKTFDIQQASYKALLSQLKPLMEAQAKGFKLTRKTHKENLKLLKKNGATQEEFDAEQTRHQTEMKGILKENMDKAVQAIGLIGDATTIVADLFKASKGDASEMGDALVSAGGKVADLVGKATGLPIGQIFSGVVGIVETIKSMFEEQSKYEAILEHTNFILEKTSRIHEINLEFIQAQIRAEEMLNDLYKTRNDMAEEQAVFSEKALKQSRKTLDDLMSMEISDSLLKRVFGDEEDAADAAKKYAKIFGVAVEDIEISERAFGGFDLKFDVKQKAGITKFMDDYEKFWTEASVTAGSEMNKALVSGLDIFDEGLAFDDPDKLMGQYTVLAQMKAAAMKSGDENLLAQVGELDKVMESIDAYMVLYELQDDFVRQGFRDRLAELEHRKKMGEFDDDELAYAKEKVSILAGLLAQAEIDFNNGEDGLITQQELWDIQEEMFAAEQAAFDLEQEMLGLKTEEGELDQEALDRLRAMNMERQALIMKSRDGTLTDADRDRVKQIEADIIAEMTAAGASPEAIAAAKAGFVSASFAEGSPEIPQDMIAQVHQGERILTSMENKDLIAAVRRGFEASPMRAIEGFVNRLMQAQQQLQEAQITTTGGDNIFAPVIHVTGGEQPEETAEAVEKTLRELHLEWHQADSTGNGR